MKFKNHFAKFMLCAFLLFLSSAEAEPVDRGYDAQHYAIKMSLDPSAGPDTFTATAELRLRASQTLETIELDAAELDLTEVRLTAPYRHILEFQRDGERLSLTLPKKIQNRQSIVLQIQYSGKVQSRHFGLFRVKDPGDANRGWLYFTQFEPTGARYFFPCNDQPADKATTEVRIEVPEAYDVVSNGRKSLERRKRRVDGVWKEFQWKMDLPHSTYLVSLAIGKFARLDKKQGVPISVWAGPKDSKAAEYALEATAESLRFLEKYLDTPYPWNKYATIGIPTFLWGGMENTSSTHMNQERFLLVDPRSEIDRRRIYSLVAHEAAHQWFGDLVTMRWWNDVWLNEAFASYLENLATGAKFGTSESDLLSWLEVWEEYFRQESGPRSRPLVPAQDLNPEEAFDSVAYTKGEAVLKMLSHQIGEPRFRKGLARYLNQFKFKNAGYRDFFDSMEKAAGKSLTAFRDTWLLQRGYPVLRYSYRWGDSSKKLTLVLAQKSNHSEDSSRFSFELPVTIHRRTSPEFHRQISVAISEASHELQIDLPAEPEWVSINSGGYVLAETHPDRPELGAVRLQAVEDPEPVNRLWALRELITPMRTGGPLPKVSEDTLVNALTSDRSPYVRMGVISLLQKTSEKWFGEELAAASLALAKQAAQPSFATSPLVLSDPHGWRQWRAKQWGMLGKVKEGAALTLLTKTVLDKSLALDELGEVARAIAARGEPTSAGLLKQALNLHSARGYSYQFAIQFAFGALERPEAAHYISEFASSSRPDLLGRLAWIIRDNQILKNSSEWTAALEKMLLENDRVDIDVKSRLLSSIEDVQNSSVRRLLERVSSKKDNPRLAEVAQKILSKNFERKTR